MSNDLTPSSPCGSCGTELHEGDEAFEQDWAVTEVSGNKVVRQYVTRVVCPSCANGRTGEEDE